jgi:hypothetical protein
MKELLRKNYNIEIEFFGENDEPLTISFQYEQGSLRGLLSIKEAFREGIKVEDWLFDFLMKKTTQSVKLTKELFEQLGETHIANLSNFIFDTYAKDFFEKSNKPKKEEDLFQNVKAPSSSLICLILEKTNESIESLLDMTWEQIVYLVEGIIWNLNAQTKEGQDKNKRNARMKMLKEETSDEDALAAIKKMEKKLNEKRNKSNQ